MLDGIIALLSFKATDSIPDAYVPLTDLIHAVGQLIAGRAYENEFPRGFVLPAVVVHQYGGNQDYDFTGPIDITEDQVQVDCYAQDSSGCRALRLSVKDLLEAFTGTLPDGTVVQAMYKERDLAMPFLPNANTKGIANRWTLGFRVVSARQ